MRAAGCRPYRKGMNVNMIRNVIFDLGRVLLEYKPDQIMKDMGVRESAIPDLMEKVFRDPIWNEFDRGTYKAKELHELFSKRYPELSAELEVIFTLDFYDKLPIKEDTLKFLVELKEKGYRIYFLSNFPPEGFELIENKFDFFKLGDGKIISGYVKLIKPEPEIYQLLIDKYKLCPEESVFFDDVPANVEAAKKLGIIGIVFTGADSAREQFYRII